MLEYNSVDKSRVNITKILVFLLKVKGKTKLLAGSRYFKNGWLFCYSDFKVFHFFFDFPAFHDFSNFFWHRHRVQRKILHRKWIFGYFFDWIWSWNSYKYQNFSDNIFFIFQIVIVTWNCAQKFPIPFGGLKNFLKTYFGV